MEHIPNSENTGINGNIFEQGTYFFFWCVCCFFVFGEQVATGRASVYSVSVKVGHLRKS